MPRTIEQVKNLAKNAHTFYWADTDEYLKIDHADDDSFTATFEHGNSCEFQYCEVVDADKFFELKEMV